MINFQVLSGAAVLGLIIHRDGQVREARTKDIDPSNFSSCNQFKLKFHTVALCQKKKSKHL